MSFEERIRKASVFEKQVFDAIEKLGFAVAINGTEHTHPDFIKSLRKSVDQTSLAIRFQPDGVAQIGKIPRSFYVEAKASKTIEKTAYEQYQKLCNVGNIVVVIFEPFKWMWCFADEMPLEDGNDTVLKYAKSRRFSVENGWMYPRKSAHGTGGRGSNTPYRCIKMRELREWATFESEIVHRLASLPAPASASGTPGANAAIPTPPKF